jgi:ATP-dependent DNA helicase RecG
MTANQVDVALASPVPEVGSQLVALEEDQWFDRKGAQIAAKDLGVPLTAFANAEGGTIVIGLHSGKVQGLKQYQAKINDIRQAPIDFTSPPVRAAFSEIKCLNERGEEDFLLAIRVEPGERVHELKNGDCYLRVGDESRKLTYHQRQELEFDKGQSQYDGFACPGVTVSDLDSGLIDGYKASMEDYAKLSLKK